MACTLVQLPHMHYTIIFIPSFTGTPALPSVPSSERLIHILYNVLRWCIERMEQRTLWESVTSTTGRVWVDGVK